MALSPTAAREKAEEWIPTRFKSKPRPLSMVGLVKRQPLLNDTRDDVERRFDDGVRRILTTLQVVTQADVAELDAKMQTIAHRIDQLESAKKPHARSSSPLRG